MQMKPRQDPGTVPVFITERCPSAQEHEGPLVWRWQVGDSRHPQASAVAMVGVMVGIVVVVVVEVVVLETRMVHVRHMARMMGTVKVSQVAPAWEEPRPDPSDSVSPYSRTIPLHIKVLLSTMQAGGQQQQQQKKSYSSACDQAHQSRAPQEA